MEPFSNAGAIPWTSLRIIIDPLVYVYVHRTVLDGQSTRTVRALRRLHAGSSLSIRQSRAYMRYRNFKNMKWNTNSGWGWGLGLASAKLTFEYEDEVATAVEDDMCINSSSPTLVVITRIGSQNSFADGSLS